ncbi:DNA-3-methyladenine glycosylase [Psychrobacter ciconiae]|uniref:DNA-3-methyladenine glycosylase n=1 Tax=Psychrobacter ciconiae TaxID=1553449 RepID=UPI00191A6B0E|nr:DNA-3-methyladenine glycosylase [Psychrobacter ciconiae]
MKNKAVKPQITPNLDHPDLNHNETAQILPPDWFARPTCVVASDLIGKIIYRKVIDEGGVEQILRMRISETEAYIGEGDRACHAHAGTRTARTEIMYHEGGVIYVYLTYGIHFMLNLVSGAAESPEAVLIRAGFFVDEAGDLDNDNPEFDIKKLSGPGKLTKQLAIDKSLYGKVIAPDSMLWVEDDGARPPVSLRPRIGIDYAGEAKDWLLRYIWTSHPSLSKK